MLDVVARTELPVLPSLTVVDDEAARVRYWRDVCRLWRVSETMTHFPGAHPMPVDDAGIARMRKGDYVVALKTDGVRYILLLTLRADGETPIALMIDRSRIMYEVCVWATYDFFRHGTLLDGELAWNLADDELPDGTMSYCVFDVVSVAGRHVADQPFAQRLQVIHDTLFRTWKDDMSEDELETHVRDESKIWCQQREPHVVTFAPKTFYPYDQTLSVWRSRGKRYNQRVDGLLFTCRSSPMAVGRTDTILKWKPHHTIDVIMARNQGGGMRVLVDERPAPTTRASKRRNASTPSTRADLAERLGCDVHVEPARFIGEDEVVVECVTRFADDGALSLLPLRRRDDKCESNALSTIRSTLHLGRVTVSSFA